MTVYVAQDTYEYSEHRVVLPPSVAEALEHLMQHLMSSAATAFNEGRLSAEEAAPLMAAAWELGARCSAGEVRDFDLPALRSWAGFFTTPLMIGLQEDDPDLEETSRELVATVGAWKWLIAQDAPEREGLESIVPFEKLLPLV